MQSQDQAARTSWSRSTLDVPPAPLHTAISTDVCIIGGGIAGLTTAYWLGRDGIATVVLEAGACGGGETLRSTAQLSTVSDHGLLRQERLLGTARARLAVQSHAAAIDCIERIVRDEGIPCGFTRLDGYLLPSPQDRYEDILEELMAAQRAGLDAEIVSATPAVRLDSRRALRCAGQAQLDPARYLLGLFEGVRRLESVRIFGHTRVAAIEPGSRVRVLAADGGKVRAHTVIVATNHPANLGLRPARPLASRRSYALAIEWSRDAGNPALYWDLGYPSHHARIAAGAGGPDLLLVGGADHPTGFVPPGSPVGDLEAWARAHFRSLGPLTHRWSGQVLETPDGLAYIGPWRTSNRVHGVYGDCGRGFTHGTIAAMILRQVVRGRRSPWQKLYDPQRRLPLNIAARCRDIGRRTWESVRRWRALIPHADEAPPLAPGRGRLERRGPQKIAACCTLEGSRIERAATCPHDGTMLTWNLVEQTWDCPCDGSRFAPTGEVLHGPASLPLAPAPIPPR